VPAGAAQDCDLLAATEHVGASPWMIASLNHNLMPMDRDADAALAPLISIEPDHSCVRPEPKN